MDPVRNPFAPGAGQRPPELAGRDREVDAFEIVLERVARGRPERSLVLTGLRGVGKTVLLGELRSMAVRAGWGAGKIEARPEADLRRPLSAALHRAIRDLAVQHRAPDRVDEVLGVLKAFALRSAPDGAKLRERWQPGIDVPPTSGRADSGDIEIDLVELFTEVAELAADVGTGVAILIDEMQDLRPDDVSALCAACHELSQSRAPLVVVGAGLPHLPAVLSASKSYSERLFKYVRIGQLDRADADFALLAPAEREDASFDVDALDALYAASGGYPYFVQAYGKAAWDAAPRSPIGAAGRQDGRAGGRGWSWRSASSAPGSSGPPRPSGSTCGRWPSWPTAGTSRSAPPASPSTWPAAPRRSRPARDSLMKKGLVFSAQRGQIAFTVPHFGRYLLAQA